MTEPLLYHENDAKAVAAAAETILEATDGIEGNTVHVACIGVAIALQDPDIKIEQLAPMIKAVSEYIVMLLSARDDQGKRAN